MSVSICYIHILLLLGDSSMSLQDLCKSVWPLFYFMYFRIFPN